MTSPYEHSNRFPHASGGESHRSKSLPKYCTLCFANPYEEGTNALLRGDPGWWNKRRSILLYFTLFILFNFRGGGGEKNTKGREANRERKNF